jgi:hypothetical protein
LFPLTVKQINNLTSNDESNLIIDGAEVNNVMFSFTTTLLGFGFLFWIGFYEFINFCVRLQLWGEYPTRKTRPASTHF